MMHLLVEDVEAWWGHVQAANLAASYGVFVEPPADRSWGIRDFVLVDPTGVLWRIGQNIKSEPFVTVPNRRAGQSRPRAA